MPEMIIVDRSDRVRTVKAAPGRNVMEIIRDSGIDDVLGVCGGCCSCATCQIYVDDAFLDRLPSMGDVENDLLDATEHRRPNSRLSCQLTFTEALDGLKVTIAPDT